MCLLHQLASGSTVSLYSELENVFIYYFFIPIKIPPTNIAVRRVWFVMTNPDRSSHLLPLHACFPGLTLYSDYASTTLPLNAAGTTFTCTMETQFTPPFLLLSGTSTGLTEVCFCVGLSSGSLCVDWVS